MIFAKANIGGDKWFCAVMMLLEGGDRTLFLSGLGSTKSEAVECALRNWGKGLLETYAPAAGSPEELKLKLIVDGRVARQF